MAMAAPAKRVKNPLEIPEVLEQVLNYVPVGDLMNAREVAKLWRDESLANFRSSIVYVLDPDTEAQQFLRMSMNIEASGGGSTTMPWEDASSSPSGMYNFQDKSIKKFRLTGPQEITPNGFNSLALGSMPYFWNQCGSHLTYLDLKGPTYLFDSSFIDALTSFFKLCPNLEELKISPLWVNDDDGAFHRLTYANEEPILDEVLISHERSWTVYNVRGPRKAQLASMKECLALKMKSLSIELTGHWDDREDPDFDDYSARCFYSILWRCLFNLMPNLKKLSLDGALYIFVMEALPRKTLTTNQLIQLDSFEYNGEKSGPSDIDFGKGLVPLGCYLRELETVTSPVPFKNLKLLKIPFRSVWGYPKTFRNILFLIRARIEALCIELRCSQGSDPEPTDHCKFDLFNFICPNLVELALEFDYKLFEYKPRDYKPYGRNANENFIFFDFSVFLGTPNLKRFKMKTLHVSDRTWLKRRLTVEDLAMNGPGHKWYHMYGVGQDKYGRNNVDDEWRTLLIETDVTETFDPEKEEGDGIVLEKMKEFYYTGRFTVEALLVLGKWMKNLKEFAAIFDDETIFLPFVIWPGTLKRLTVLQSSFEGVDQVSGKLISDLREMYPEVEIVLEGQIDIPMDRLAVNEDADSISTFTSSSTSDKEEDDEEW